MRGSVSMSGVSIFAYLSTSLRFWVHRCMILCRCFCLSYSLCHQFISSPSFFHLPGISLYLPLYKTADTSPLSIPYTLSSSKHLRRCETWLCQQKEARMYILLVYRLHSGSSYLLARGEEWWNRSFLWLIWSSGQNHVRGGLKPGLGM